jgi:citrate synthase
VYGRVNIDRAINMNRQAAWISAADASRALGVSRATLYAYVSRGFVRSQSAPGPSRERRYSRDDVERLRRRSEERRDPEKAAARALQWGVPVLESAITFIDGSRLFYRRHDAVAVSDTRSIEDVASLVWTGTFDTTFPVVRRAPRLAARFADARLPFVGRAQSVLAAASAHDPLAVDLRPAGVAQTGWRIVWLLAHTATLGRDSAATIDGLLAHAWGAGSRGATVLRRALILCADHELNVSSFTARCVASAGANPYAVVTAGLAALEGIRHGGAGARVESMLASMRRTRHLRTAISERLRRGDTIDGFGHPLYRDGDPRAAALLDVLRDGYARSAELAFVLDAAAAVESILREKPNLDFALAAVSRVLRLPPAAPLSIFAIGRSIGWVAHAIEQYATGQLIRPRAKYIGDVPPAADRLAVSSKGRRADSPDR